jgi:VanZ family protein
MVRWAAPGGWGAGWRRSGMLAALAAYGTGIESLQPFVPNAGRTFDWADLLMNVAGVILGAWLCERLVADGRSQAAPAPP